ncbi:MAG: patatin-like phospholipase family protein [Flavobacteriaceae bacterium]|nr:patatin-like phospholipase family protein [Flavobacteriaceae bacterium]
MSAIKKQTVSLVLGSGGARGLAHVGVIRWLEAHDFEIKSISGCSIGAAIGGAYAMGNLDSFVAWLTGYKRSDMYFMLDFIFGKGGFVKGDKVLETIKKQIGVGLIEELPIKFTAVAADIANEEEVWLQEGALCQAIRASISLPLFFTPYELNGVKLLDGGILNPTPIEPTLKDDTDITIVVNLGGTPELKLPEKVIRKDPWQRKLDVYINKMKKYRNKTSNEWSMMYVADQSFNAMQNAIAQQKMKMYPPDYIINIPRNKCNTLEFEKSAEMIAFGYEMAGDVLGELCVVSKIIQNDECN